MSNHTPTPWVAIKGDSFNPERPWGVSKYLSLEECQEIDGDDAEYPSRTEVIAEVCDGVPGIAEADAKFIVQAVNSHAALVEALEEMIRFWERTKGVYFQQEKMEDQIYNMKQALALATGQAPTKG